MSGRQASGLRPAGVWRASGARLAQRTVGSGRCASSDGDVVLTYRDEDIPHPHRRGSAPTPTRGRGGAHGRAAGWLAAVAGAMLLCIAPAAAGTFAPPPGCTGYLTVQAKTCKVSNHFTCAGDPEGHQWRVDFGPAGPYFASRIDREAQWVQSIELGEGTSRWLVDNPPDPQSFTALLQTGIDTFDFRLRGPRGETVVRGFDRLTGRTVVIDGVTLTETAFEYHETRADSTPVVSARGNEYLHPEWRIFLAGPSEADRGDGYAPFDASPVQFRFPGQPGFLSDTPLFGCDDTLSAAPESLIPAPEHLIPAKE